MIPATWMSQIAVQNAPCVEDGPGPGGVVGVVPVRDEEGDHELGDELTMAAGRAMRQIAERSMSLIVGPKRPEAHR